MSSMEVPAKTEITVVFSPPLFDTFRDFTGYNSSLTDMTTLTLCWFGLFMNHVSTWRNTYSGE